MIGVYLLIVTTIYGFYKFEDVLLWENAGNGYGIYFFELQHYYIFGHRNSMVQN